MRRCALGYFALGVGIGAATTLLLAPQSGEETRRMLSSKAEEGRDYLSEQKQALRAQADNLRTAAGRAGEQLMNEGEDLASHIS